jgi:YfiH family protein
MPGVVRHVRLAPDVEVHLTGSSIEGVEDANLAHHRPHLPAALAAARAQVGALSGTDPTTWTMMRQVHGADVGDADALAPGSEVRAVDALVSTSTDRPLVVLTADCVPLVIAGATALAVVHAGWRGVAADVVGRTVEAMLATGEERVHLRAMVGPSIGPCCYAVGEEVRLAIASVSAQAPTTTRDARPSVDLVGACAERLATFGIELDTSAWECTSCGAGGWFSHRRDPMSGRQATIALRRGIPG